jgi:hypothetical protein
LAEESNREEAVIEAAESLLSRVAAWQMRLVPRWRRITRAMYGLGILDITGNDWVRITRRGIAFRPLTPAQADRLARHLEDLENGVRVAPALPGPGQYPLDFLPVPDNGPVPVESSYHAGVGR